MFPPCGLSFFEISMCPGLFLVHSLLLFLHHMCDQQYDGGSGRRRTYVFCLLPITLLVLLLLLLFAAMVKTCCASVTIIFSVSDISLEIVALDLLSVALAWESFAKAC